LAALIAVTAAGCAGPARQPLEDAASAWAERRASLQALSAWRAEGRLSARVERDGGQAHFAWSQSGSRFRLRLGGPWGQGAAILEAEPDRVTLDTGEGRRYRGTDARSLLASVYGWDIPVAELRYWLVGLPGPRTQFSLDEYGRLARLTWQDWRIVYSGYEQVDGRALPSSIRIEREPDARGSVARVKLVVDQWRLGRASDAADANGDNSGPIFSP
jgi:outer membrane lipoprotein LolB